MEAVKDNHGAEISKAKMSMKLFIDKNSNRVVYAETGKDCVDCLLHVFLMPLGTAMRQLFNGAIVDSGSLRNLYGSVEDMGVDYMESMSDTKSRLLNPEAFKRMYNCETYRCASFCVSDGEGASCPHCKTLMKQEITYVAPPRDMVNGEGYVKGQVTYMITDDFVVKPLCTTSTLALLNHLNANDIRCIELVEVTIDANKGMELLKASLVSNTVLTDTFLSKTGK